MKTNEKMTSPSEYVTKVLSDRRSYLLNGNDYSKMKAQLEYKEIKSPAFIHLELLSQGKILVPRWLV